MFMNDPKNNVLDQIRVIIGDTDNDELLLSQSVLEYIYESNGKNVNTAAIKALEAIIMSSAKYTDEDVGDVSIKLSQRFKQLRQTLADLKKRTAFGKPYAGGISNSDIAARVADPDNPVKLIEQGWSTSYGG